MPLIPYCDTCGVPLKEGQYHILYSYDAKTPPPSPADYTDRNLFYREYNNYLEDMQKKAKMICPTCKMVIDKIFELRFKNLCQLSNELLGIYNLPTYKGLKKKRGKK